MVVDVDPKFCRADCWEGRAEPVLNCGIERDRNIDIFRFNRWFGEQTRIRQKTVLLEHAFFVPDANVFAELFEGKAEGELAAKRIAIRANMTKDCKSHTFAQRPADLLELGCAHSCFSLSASICCKISTTREPRAIDSSR